MKFVDFLFESTSLLSEGGLGGHMPHIFEDLSLTFGQIKDILSKASNGELEATEKVDGFNIFLTFRHGVAWCARNKGDIKKGGMDMDDLIARDFAGGDDVKKVFVEAFTTFENAMSTLSQEDLDRIFGENGDIYYNTEILGPSAKNVINYDNNVIAIHRTGHAFFDRQSGNRVEDIDVSQNSQYLDEVIDKIEDASASDENSAFVVHRTAFLNLKGIEDDKFLRQTLTNLNKEISRYGLSDSNTVSDYLLASIREKLEQTGLPIDKEEWVLDFASEVILGTKNLKEIPKGTSKETRSFISQFGKSKKESKTLFKQAIKPIEIIIHKFAIKLLNSVESAYVHNNSALAQSIKDDVKKAIEALKDYSQNRSDLQGAEQAKKFLETQASKIDIKNINSAVEGISFVYKGKVYKFTGNFAPINQLIGLYKWGRGSIPALKDWKDLGSAGGQLNELESPSMIGIGSGTVPDERQAKEYGLGLYLGSFKPPHDGHFTAAKNLADMQNADGTYKVREVKVLISHKPRYAENSYGETVKIDQEDSKRLWDIYTKEFSKIKPEIVPPPNPMIAAKRIIEDLPSNSKLYILTPIKNKKRDLYDEIVEYAEKLNIPVEKVVTPMFSNNISGTKMRNFIVKKNKDSFLDNLPSHLSPSEKEEAWSIASREDNILDKKKSKRERGYTAMRRGKSKLNEVSQKAVDYLNVFLDGLESSRDKDWARGLSFDHIFNGKTRLVSDFPVEFKGEAKKVIRMIEDSGWKFDVLNNQITRDYEYVIPAGPKKGEVLEKTDKISANKWMASAVEMGNNLSRFVDYFSQEENYTKVYKQCLGAMILGEPGFHKKLIKDKQAHIKVNSEIMSLARGSGGSKRLLTPSEITSVLNNYDLESIYNSSVLSTINADSNTKLVDFLTLWFTSETYSGFDEFTFSETLSSYATKQELFKPYFNDRLFKGVPSKDKESLVSTISKVLPDFANYISKLDSIKPKEIEKFLYNDNGQVFENQFNSFILVGPTPAATQYERDRPAAKERLATLINNLKEAKNYWDTHGSKDREYAKSGGDKKIIYTRHPIDVLKMSDFEDTDIVSCHSENSAHGYFKCAMAEAHGHGLCAYVVKEKDLEEFLGEEGSEEDMVDGEIFVDHDRRSEGEILPFGRVRIRRIEIHFDDEDEERQSYEIMAPELRMYGQIKSDEFYLKVCEWVWENQIAYILQQENVSTAKELVEKWNNESGWASNRKAVLTGGSYTDNSAQLCLESLFEANGYSIDIRRWNIDQEYDDAEQEYSHGLLDVDNLYYDWSPDTESITQAVQYRLQPVEAEIDLDVYSDEGYQEGDRFDFSFTVSVDFKHSFDIGEVLAKVANSRNIDPNKALFTLSDLWEDDEEGELEEKLEEFLDWYITQFNLNVDYMAEDIDLNDPMEYVDINRNGLFSIDMNLRFMVEDSMNIEGLEENRFFDILNESISYHQCMTNGFQFEPDSNIDILNKLSELGLIKFQKTQSYSDTLKVLQGYFSNATVKFLRESDHSNRVAGNAYQFTFEINPENLPKIIRIPKDVQDLYWSIEGLGGFKMNKALIIYKDFMSDLSTQSNSQDVASFMLGELTATSMFSQGTRDQAWRISSYYHDDDIDKNIVELLTGHSEVVATSRKDMDNIRNGIDANMMFVAPTSIKNGIDNKNDFITQIESSLNLQVSAKLFESTNIAEKIMKLLTSLNSSKKSQIFDGLDRSIQVYNKAMMTDLINLAETVAKHKKYYDQLLAKFGDIPPASMDENLRYDYDKLQRIYANSTNQNAIELLIKITDYFGKPVSLNEKITFTIRKDTIKGGLADKMVASDFSRDQIKKGMKVELEHTKDYNIALEIALDHLAEDPNYYDKLVGCNLEEMSGAGGGAAAGFMGNAFIEEGNDTREQR